MKFGIINYVYYFSLFIVKALTIVIVYNNNFLKNEFV